MREHQELRREGPEAGSPGAQVQARGWRVLSSGRFACCHCHFALKVTFWVVMLQAPAALLTDFSTLSLPPSWCLRTRPSVSCPVSSCSSSHLASSAHPHRCTGHLPDGPVLMGLGLWEKSVVSVHHLQLCLSVFVRWQCPPSGWLCIWGLVWRAVTGVVSRVEREASLSPSPAVCPRASLHATVRAPVGCAMSRQDCCEDQMREVDPPAPLLLSWPVGSCLRRPRLPPAVPR